MYEKYVLRLINVLKKLYFILLINKKIFEESLFMIICILVLF